MPAAVVPIAHAIRQDARVLHYEAIIAELNVQLAELEARIIQVRFHRDAWLVIAEAYRKDLETRRSERDAIRAARG